MSKPSDLIVLTFQLVKSPAWLSLTGMAPQVYLLFRTKCQISKRYGKPGRHDRVIVNNGEIEFTYIEAKEKYGMTAPQFKRAVDQLIDRGFIDVAATGMGVYKVKTCYAVSDRWEEYGKPVFREAKRPAASIRNCGFKPGNKHWKKARREFPTDVLVHGAVHTNVHGEPIAMYTNVHGRKVRISPKSLERECLCSEIT